MIDPLNTDPEFLKQVFDETEICRKPFSGIVSGYHHLPFTLVGPNDEQDTENQRGTLKLTGKIQVSPKLVISINSNDERFSDMFPENEPFMDRSLIGRVFSFSNGYRKNLRVRNEFLSVESIEQDHRQVLERVLDDLARAEATGMGVVWCPAPRFYPVSLERFILAVLDRELR